MLVPETLNRDGAPDGAIDGAVRAAPDIPAAGSANREGAGDVVYGRFSRATVAGDLAIGDLPELLSAVKVRLRAMVIETPPGASRNAARPPVPTVRSGVLECVLALEQIQASLARELERRDALEMEIADTQAALAQALADLAGTQAGERHARHLAQHDSLTSLPNRAFFLERLEAELSALPMRHHCLAVLYLDLDAFKPINDQYGHAMGDELLRIVGIRLSRAVRMDDMVCRLGGDEFACLLADVQGRAQLASLARKLIDAVAAPLKVGKRRLLVRPSVGIALCPEHGSSSETVMRNADQAMYQAKRHQTGFAFFDPVAAA